MLLVGLGNPGKKYDGTRHNIGFALVDAVVSRYGFTDPREKFKGELCEGEVEGVKIYALKPTTFMNNSGISVQEIVRFYKIPLEKIMVAYDELDLALGKLRIKTGGGDGGHNGIKSLDAHIGHGYRRMRIGINHPGDPDKVTGYVLNKFTAEEQPAIDKIIDAAADAFPLLVQNEDEKFMTKVALTMQPPKPKTEKPEPKQAEEPENNGV